MTLGDLMTDGNYLPEFMRDFHAQKRIFKWLDEVVQRRRQKDDTRFGSGDVFPNWVQAHVYVVDVFLWCMARRGYTLQKCRKQGIEFVDLEQDLRDFDERERKALAEMFKAESSGEQS